MIALRYLSVCSGIEAASVAWEPLGWRAHAFAEIEAFPSAVLAARHPGVPNWGDMTKFKDWPDAAINLLVGGTPCQSFSVAGLRRGLDDPRGNLALTYLGIADRYRPEWLLWENVPGVLSLDGGRAFGSIIGGMAELGYGWAYRIIDAQFVRVDGFGRAVPQRRRRVFVVGHLGDWRRAAAVLFEPESLSGNPPPRREAGQGIARPIAGGSDRSSGYRNDADTADNLLAFGGNDTSGPIDVATARNAHAGPHGRLDFESETFVAQPIAFDCKAGGDTSFAIGDVPGSLRGEGHGGGHAAIAHPYTLAIRGRGDTHQLEYRQDGTANAVLTPNGGRAGIGVGAIAAPIGVVTNDSAPVHTDGSYCPTLRVGTGLEINSAPAVAFSENIRGEVVETEISRALQTTGGKAGQGYVGVRQGWAVRRLTPTECEALQGFPRDYTAITYRGKPAADGPRYKALGNSMAVNAMRWIGHRIDLVDSIAREQREAV